MQLPREREREDTHGMIITTLDLQDGSVTVVDLTIIAQVVVGSIQLTPEEFAQADFDGNGTVNIQVNQWHVWMMVRWTSCFIHVCICVCVSNRTRWQSLI